MPDIRQIGPTDSVEELAELLHRAYAPLGKMGLNYTAIDQSLGTTIERINAGFCLVATEEGRLIGTIVVEPTGKKDAECPYFAKPGVASAHQMAVAPDRQRRGIGTRLLEAAEAWARSNGFFMAKRLNETADASLRRDVEATWVSATRLPLAAMQRKPRRPRPAARPARRA